MCLVVVFLHCILLSSYRFRERSTQAVRCSEPAFKPRTLLSAQGTKSIAKFVLGCHSNLSFSAHEGWTLFEEVVLRSTSLHEDLFLPSWAIGLPHVWWGGKAIHFFCVLLSAWGPEELSQSSSFYQAFPLPTSVTPTSHSKSTNTLHWKQREDALSEMLGASELRGGTIKT